MLHDAIQRPLVTLINRALDDTPWARERLREFSEEHFTVQIGAHRGMTFRIEQDGRLGLTAPSLPEQTEPVEAVRIHLRPQDIPAEAIVAGEPERVMQAVRLEGCAEMADTLGFVFRNLKPDIEEIFARRIGDVAAHRLCLAFAAIRRETRRSLSGARANLTEYVQHEGQHLPAPLEVQRHMHDVATFRDDLARLEKRVQQLTHSRHS